VPTVRRLATGPVGRRASGEFEHCGMMPG
jgi:hypothetical protein